jgi:hypothetical protein
MPGRRRRRRSLTRRALPVRGREKCSRGFLFSLACS